MEAFYHSALFVRASRKIRRANDDISTPLSKLWRNNPGFVENHRVKAATKMAQKMLTVKQQLANQGNKTK